MVKRRPAWRRMAVMILAALMLMSLVAHPAGAATTTITFTDFTDLSSIVLSGTTAGLGNPVGPNKVLRLTNNLSQAGGAFLQDPIPLQDPGGFKASFSTAFRFQITDPVGCVDTDGVQGADGLVFVVQTQSNQYGGAGVGIGYWGIPKSVGIEFDTWNNGGIDRNNGNHVGVNINGDINSAAYAPVTEGHMNNGQIWHAWIDYDGDAKQLEVRVSQNSTRPVSPLVTHTVDLPAVLTQPDAYVGFTSGTGCAGGDHDILSWEFRNTFNPIGACPEGFTWRSPLSSSATHSMPVGGSLNIAFQWCDPSGFVRDEGVILMVVDKATEMPITAWVYGFDIEIDDVNMEYRQTFNAGAYGLTPGQALRVEAYLGGLLTGVADLNMTP